MRASWNTSTKKNSVSVSLEGKTLSAGFYTVEVEPMLDNMTTAEAYTISSQIAKANMFYNLNGYTSTIDFLCNGAIPSNNIPIIIHFIPKERTMITAHVDDVGNLTAIEGMTWGEWLNSPYAPTYGINVTTNLISFEVGTSTVYLSVNLADFIIRDHSYETTLDQCCFVPGTQVLMSSGEFKSIENITIGEEVVSYNVDTGEMYNVIVVKTIENKCSTEMAEIIFDNGMTLAMTDYHPIYTASGWKSLTGHLGYDLLEVGQMAKTFDGWSEIIDIKQYKNETPISTYTLDVANKEELDSRDDNTHDNFYANGIVVHNASCPT